MAQQQFLTKTLTTSSSGFLGLYSSGATNPTAYTSGATAAITTSSGSVATNLDTGRRIVVWTSSIASDNMLITLTGLASNGLSPMSETIRGSCAAGITNTTVQDFYNLTSITMSSAPTAGVHFGTSSRAGTPWMVTNTWATPFDLTVNITMSSTINSLLANFETTLEDITQDTIPGPTKFLSSSPTVQVPYYPTPIILQVAGSTFVSTVIDAQTANITTPIAAWRVTLTSSSSTAGSMAVSVLQSG
jgi:hypothetical protein